MEFGVGLWGMQRPHLAPRGHVRMYEEMLEHAALAEEVGFDAFFLTEHHFWYDGYCPSLLPALGAVARRTHRIGIGTGALLLPLHDPLRVAEDAAVVDVLSGGRLILGFGLGYRPEEFDGLRTQKRTRGDRAVEEIQIIRKAFGEEAFSHVGAHYRYENVRLVPRPVQRPHPPIWFAAGTALATARRAGRAGLPYWHATATTLDMVANRIEEYRRAASEAGFPPEAQRVALTRDICIAETQAEAEQIMWQERVATYEEQLVGFGFILDEQGRPLSELSRDLPVFDRILRSLIVGTPDRVITEIQRYVPLGIDLFVARLLSAAFDPQQIRRWIKLFGREVIPHFRAGGRSQ